MEQLTYSYNLPCLNLEYSFPVVWCSYWSGPLVGLVRV